MHKTIHLSSCLPYGWYVISDLVLGDSAQAATNASNDDLTQDWIVPLHLSSLSFLFAFRICLSLYLSYTLLLFISRLCLSFWSLSFVFIFHLCLLSFSFIFSFIFVFPLCLSSLSFIFVFYLCFLSLFFFLWWSSASISSAQKLLPYSLFPLPSFTILSLVTSQSPT